MSGMVHHHHVCCHIPVHSGCSILEIVGRSQHCHNGARTLLAYELTNLVVDIFILCLPIGMIRKSGLPYDRQCAVSLIFLLGGFVCITSMVRLRYMWILPSPKTAFDVGNVMLWSTIQLGLAIICACLPTFGPLLKYPGFLASRFKHSCRSFVSSKSSLDRSKRSSLPSAGCDLSQTHASHTNTNTQEWKYAGSHYFAPDDGLFTLHKKNNHEFRIGVLPSTRSSSTE
ncbi:unnamed protein product [Periconia digitata]|uniref:Rhodopsin domain-containing protein n=1 Tax=Periconia digitata TaxID=1303443 RepID=A0A9W4XMW6_9PLEO|nr:unnamed protein product [Periconia digitata]